MIKVASQLSRGGRFDYSVRSMGTIEQTLGDKKLNQPFKP